MTSSISQHLLYWPASLFLPYRQPPLQCTVFKAPARLSGVFLQYPFIRPTSSHLWSPNLRAHNHHHHHHRSRSPTCLRPRHLLVTGRAQMCSLNLPILKGSLHLRCQRHRVRVREWRLRLRLHLLLVPVLRVPENGLYLAIITAHHR